jgi:hypothetical protein
MTEPMPEPGDSRTASREDFERAAADVRTGSPVAQRASAAVARHLWPGEVLVGGLVGRESLVAMYARRLKRSAELRHPTIGLGDLVQDLTDRVDLDQVCLFVTARNGMVISLFTDPDVRWLIGCVSSEPAAATDAGPVPVPAGAPAD